MNSNDTFPGLLTYGRVLSFEEAEKRQSLFARALDGNEDALAAIRDEYFMRTLVIRGKRLIWGGVLVGAKP
jgi:hypothetical protein